MRGEISYGVHMLEMIVRLTYQSVLQVKPLDSLRLYFDMADGMRHSYLSTCQNYQRGYTRTVHMRAPDGEQFFLCNADRSRYLTPYLAKKTPSINLILADSPVRFEYLRTLG